MNKIVIMSLFNFLITWRNVMRNVMVARLYNIARNPYMYIKDIGILLILNLYITMRKMYCDMEKNVLVGT